ncbi:MAG: hypothetical protein JF616_06305 [Fibrobacteres bacterium]|jgi:hypothetical protein|nr:hypothetical protein [Fibrobacterota bacterium]
MAEVLWIGGWASDLACWHGALDALYPGRTHRFLDAHALLDGAADLRAEAARLPPGGCLAAWSLGSLLMHQALMEGWRPSCRILSLSPIFDFCRAGGRWPQAAVLRMARRLPSERDKVLAEFRSAAWGQSQVPGEWAEAWDARVRSYSDDSLVLGLRTLAEAHLEKARLPSVPGLVFLASPEDPLSPAAPGADPRWRSYPGGHLPFLDFPGLVAPLLPAPEKAA